MAILINAVVLCDTDDPAAARAGVFAALNTGAFETRNPVADFGLGEATVVPFHLPCPTGALARLAGSAFETADAIAAEPPEECREYGRAECAGSDAKGMPNG